MERMAAHDDNTEILPLLSDDVPHFDAAMRGYDKRQVDEYVARAEREIRELQSARDAALAASADRAAQLASREAQIESLGRQKAAAADTITPANVSDRIRDMLQLANEEATQTRKAAEEEAERVLIGARADAERLRSEAAAEQQRLMAAATQRSAEADQKLALARTQAGVETANAKALIAELSDAAAAERSRLDAESAAARAELEQQSAHRIETAEQDFDITLRSRRKAAERQQEQDYQQARTVAVNLVDDATREVQTLAGQRDEIHARLRDLHADLGDVVDSIGSGDSSAASGATAGSADSVGSADSAGSADSVGSADSAGSGGTVGTGEPAEPAPES
ncbi:MAG: hypothetical protein JWN95_894 [Frankiales bacterium]|nr:hypothetical protein [Frankiales bacterium]